MRQGTRDRLRVAREWQSDSRTLVEGHDRELLIAGALGGERPRGGHRPGERRALHAWAHVDCEHDSEVARARLGDRRDARARDRLTALADVDLRWCQRPPVWNREDE